MARELTANFGANTSGFTRGVERIKADLTRLNAEFENNKKALSDANKKLKELETEYKDLAEATGNGAHATEEQARRMRELETSIGQTRAQVASLRTEQASLRIDINRTTGELREQRNATVDVKKELSDLGGTVRGAAAGFTAIISAIAALTYSSASAADDINTLAAQYGLSAEEIQKFKYATDLIDVSLEAYTGSLAKNIRSMTQYANGTAAVVEAYDTLGVAVKKSDGTLRDSGDVYNEVIRALSKIEDSTQRDSIAMTILGRSAQELNPLILGGAEALEQLGQQAENLGLILPQEELDRLNDMNDKVDTLKANLEGLKMVVGAEFAESFDSFFDAGDDFVEFIQGLKEDGTLADMAEKLSNTITALVGVLKTAIDIGWKCKDVIIAGVVAMTTFKTAISIGNIIVAAVRAIKSFEGALNLATIAQKALNAAGAANYFVLIASAAISAVTAITAFAASASSAAKSTEELKQEISELSNEARKAADNADKLDDVISRYTEIKNSEMTTAEKADELRRVQEELNGAFGAAADAIDLVNGKYDDNIDKLKEMTKRELELAQSKARAELNVLLKAQASDIDTTAEMMPTDLSINGTYRQKADWYRDFIKQLEEWGDANTESDYYNKIVEQWSYYEEQARLIEEANSTIAETTKRLDEIQKEETEDTKRNTQALNDNNTAAAALIARIKELSAAEEENKKSAKDLTDAYKKAASAMQEYAENGELSLSTALDLIDSGYAACIAIDSETGAVRLNVEAYRELINAKIDAQTASAELERQELEEYTSRLKMQQSMSMSTVIGDAIQSEINDAENRLAELNAQLAIFDRFRSDAQDWGSDDYRSPFTSGGSSSGGKSADSGYTDAYNAYKTEADKKIALIDRELAAKKKLRDETIAAINDEIAARKRLNEDKNIDRRINSVKAQLKYGQLDDFSRAQLEKQLQNLNDEKSEILWQRDAEARKNAANAEYDAYSEQAAAEKQSINESIATFKSIVDSLARGLSVINTNVNNYNNNTANINLAAQALTTAQITQAVKDALMDNITIR